MIVPCESLPKFRSEAMRPVVAAGFALSLVKKYFAASSMRYRAFSERGPIGALDAQWFFAALPRVRARLAELRVARFATHSQSSNNSKLANDARGRTGA
jgi:hypothetical protein